MNLRNFQPLTPPDGHQSLNKDYKKQTSSLDTEMSILERDANRYYLLKHISRFNYSIFNSTTYYDLILLEIKYKIQCSKSA